MTYTEKQKEACARWYKKNRGAISQKRKGNRKEEHKASYKRLLELRGRDYINEQSREYRKRNPEKVKETLKRSRKSNPERTFLIVTGKQIGRAHV